MGPALDPKAVLEALIAGGKLAFPAPALERARALANAPETASAADLEGLPEPLALAVLEGAVRKRNPALPEALAESSSKALAKAGKKALYQLRSLGVNIPERKSTAPAPTPTKAGPEPLPALLTPVTGNGERGLILGRPLRSGVEALQVIFSDELGILQLVSREVSRGMYREVMREPKEGKAPPAIEVALDEARALIANAAARSLLAKTPFPQGTDEALRHFGIVPEEHPLQLPPPEADDTRLAAEGAALHEEPEIRSWLPPIEALRSLALKTEEIATSQLYINDVQRQEQVGHQTRSAAEAYFTPQIQRLYAARLWAMADFFRRSNRPQAAQRAAAEARRLFAATPGLSPFCSRLFEKVLELSKKMREGEALPQPGEAAASSTPAPAERRSPGGLILP